MIINITHSNKLWRKWGRTGRRTFPRTGSTGATPWNTSKKDTYTSISVSHFFNLINKQGWSIWVKTDIPISCAWTDNSVDFELHLHVVGAQKDVLCPGDWGRSKQQDAEVCPSVQTRPRTGNEFHFLDFGDQRSSLHHFATDYGHLVGHAYFQWMGRSPITLSWIIFSARYE